MTVPAPAAPTSAAPAAPASPAPSAPAPAASAPASAATRVASMFDHLAIEEKPAAEQPAMDTPLGDVTQPGAPKPTEAAKPAEPSQPADPKDPAAAKPAEPVAKKWAGRFDKPEDMEVAYTESSKEGRRLAGVVKETQAALEKANQEMSILKLEKDIGPELKDLTDEQMSTMTPQQVALHVAKQSEQRQGKIRMQEKMEAKATADKAAAEALTNHIVSTAQAMERDAQRYPDYGELKPIISELMDFEPGITGHRNTPMILYLAAKGIRAAEAERVAKAATKTSTEDAKIKAAADGSAAGNTGAPGSEKTPAGAPSGLDPNSDAAHNFALLKGSRPRPVFG